jgi:hypothetical protein
MADPGPAVKSNAAGLEVADKRNTWVGAPVLQGVDPAVDDHPRPSDMTRNTLRRRAALTVLVAAFLSFVLSVTLWFTGSREQGLFVGLWVPSILSFGSVALQLENGRRG